MAFINNIPTNIPGLTHLAAVNDKVLKPGLGVAQTAKGYCSTIKKDKPKDQTQHIVIETISLERYSSIRLVRHYRPHIFRQRQG